MKLAALESKLNKGERNYTLGLSDAELLSIDNHKLPEKGLIRLLVLSNTLLLTDETLYNLLLILPHDTFN